MKKLGLTVTIVLLLALVDTPWLFLHSEVQLTAIRKKVTGFVVHPSERLVWLGADKK